MKLILALLSVSALFGLTFGYRTAISSELSNVVSFRPFKVIIDTSESPPGHGDVQIGPNEHDEWTDYIRVNTSRIDAWVANPPGDAYFAGQFVLITFTRPVNLEEFHRAVDPLLGEDGKFDWYQAVGKRHDGRWGEEWTGMMPDESLFVERIPPPLPDGTQHRYTIGGIMQAALYLGSSGVSADSFVEVDQLEFVHLVDTTPIQVAKEASVELDSYSVRSPFYLLLP